MEQKAPEGEGSNIEGYGTLHVDCGDLPENQALCGMSKKVQSDLLKKIYHNSLTLFIILTKAVILLQTVY